MKPENKLPVLDLISAGMKTVVNTLQPDLPPWPATGTIAEQRQYYTLERRFWNAGAPEMATRAYMVPTKYGQVETRDPATIRSSANLYTIGYDTTHNQLHERYL